MEQKPYLKVEIDRLSFAAWPEFLHYGDVKHWSRLFDTFAHFQIVICEPENQLIAVGHVVPVTWSGMVDNLPATITEILTRALSDSENSSEVTTLAALAAMVSKTHQKQGLSSILLQAMKAIGAKYNLTSLIAPVRPTLKSKYPLIPIHKYVRWTRSDGLPFDPWMRVHSRLGAQSLEVAPQTITVKGSIAEWQTWTKMIFPESGDYVVQGALQPVHIDCLKDEGVYQDPNIWMRHHINSEDAYFF
ncbi:hypothetical protein ACFL27_23910 [candidate division CSSED10-310 bacterium]|uniref:GNAT family N-acetyltransferase n=1 Tax=candidate division CSSED10-310 bacterium TaxID=2855610 RepID=A0ABV6Z487_UNCC1